MFREPHNNTYVLSLLSDSVVPMANSKRYLEKFANKGFNSTFLNNSIYDVCPINKY